MTLIKEDNINAEMLTHVALCTHREPKDVLILGAHEHIDIEIAKYEGLHVNLSDGISGVERAKDASVDVVIVNSDRLFEATFIAQINRVLKEDGLVVLKTNEKLKENMQSLGNAFGIVMTYEFAGKRAILASKKYHPTADIILQRADLLENLNYYNAQIHLSAFALPTQMSKDLLGIQKN